MHAWNNVIKPWPPSHIDPRFSATHWTFHFETATKCAARYVISVLQKHKHVFPMSLRQDCQISNMRLDPLQNKGCFQDTIFNLKQKAFFVFWPVVLCLRLNKKKIQICENGDVMHMCIKKVYRNAYVHRCIVCLHRVTSPTTGLAYRDFSGSRGSMWMAIILTTL